MGWHACVFRRGCEAEPSDARRRKRIHLRQDHGRAPVTLRTYPRPGLRRRESRDTAVAPREAIDHRRNINPISFELAHRYFDLPDDLPCIVSDFRKFVFEDRASYDGIAIDVGGPGFRFSEEFDAETCDAIRARLAPGGRIVMNVMVSDDIDPIPDRIAARLAGEELRSWSVAEQFIVDRNAVIACLPERTIGSRTALDRVMRHSHEQWAIRRGRLRSRDLGFGSR